MRKYVFAMIAVLFIACRTQNKKEIKLGENMEKKLESATLAGGCFWCLEAAFDRLKGVEKVVSGFAGGHTENPTYKQVCNGDTGHAEVVRIFYNPEEISYATLLEVFWVIHDPTQLNRQGNDIGTQYRSAIFYESDSQKEIALQSMKQSIARGDYKDSYVTEIEPLTHFYPAEDYHTDYYENNKTQPYCSAVIAPKMQKFQKKFHNLLKP